MKKHPTAMRYERVSQILSVEPLFKNRIGEKTCSVACRGGDALFPKEIIAVTNAIHQRGLDAHNLSRTEVLKIGAEILDKPVGEAKLDQYISKDDVPQEAIAKQDAIQPRKRGRPRKNALPVAAPSPTPPKKRGRPRKNPIEQSVQPVVEPPKKRGRPRKNPLPIETPITSSEPVRAKRRYTKRSTEVPEEKTEKTKSEVDPTLVESPIASHFPFPIENSEVLSKLPIEIPATPSANKIPAYYVHSSVFSLLLSALQLAYIYDREPDCAKRIKDLDSICVRYSKTCAGVKGV